MRASGTLGSLRGTKRWRPELDVIIKNCKSIPTIDQGHPGKKEILQSQTLRCFCLTTNVL